ncbi:MAG: flippase-like domain-containing protein [Planctomycetes bacterium]|nr:flippase-like domain-containing protein [Planctomycetota bacterium]
MSASSEPASESSESSANAAEGMRWKGFTLKLLAAAALIYFLYRMGYLDPEKLKRPLEQPGTIALALVIAAVAISMSGLRWWLLLRLEGIHIGLGRSVWLTWIGHFFNMVFPGAVMGDGVKMFYIGQAVPERRAEAWTTVLADRVIGLTALVALSIGASLLNLDFMLSREELRWVLAVMVALLVGALIGGVILATGFGSEWAWLQEQLKRIPKHESLARAYRVLRRLGRNPLGVGATLVFSFSAHCMNVFNAYLLGCAASDDRTLAFLNYCTLFPIAMFSNAVAFTPGGLGVGEGVLGKLFAWSGAPAELGTTVMLWWRMLFYVLALVGAACYLSYRRDPLPQGRSLDAEPAAAPREAG